jgi:hypothetical protein
MLRRVVVGARDLAIDAARVLRPDNTALRHPREATAKWLTAALRREGILSTGHVARIHRTGAFNSVTAHLTRLEITYSENAPAGVPAHILLKTPHKGVGELVRARNRREVEFYQKMIGGRAGLPVVRCYAAEAGDTHSHLLLDDLSFTHGHPEWPLAPTRAQAEAMIDALACVHSAWWGDRKLQEMIAPSLDDSELRPAIAKVCEMIDAFLSFLGDHLPPSRRETFAALIRSPDLLARLAIRAGPARFTLCLGDAHPGNFLHPKTGVADSVRIIDWEFWNVGFGTDDLAGLMALNWYPSLRRELEREMLQRYHRALIAHGVAGYSWDDCWTDYRYSVIGKMAIPASQWAAKFGPVTWVANLERIVSSYEDLECAELLGV